MSTRKKTSADRKLQSAMDDKRELSRRYRSALRENEELRREMRAVHEIRKATSTHIIKPRKGKNTSEAVAFSIASDWHIEEEVRPGTVMGMNKFNLDVAKERSDAFWRRTARLVAKEQQDVVVSELVVGLLGDFITGRLHEENLENCLLRPVEAIVYAQELVEAGIVFLLEHTNLKLTFICKAGNHTRMTRKVHFSTEMGNALELSMYHNLRKRFENEKRVTFVIDDSYLTYLDIYGYSIRFHHGHAVRYYGGVGGLTIPMNKAIAQWDINRQANLSVCGHFHQYMPMRRFVVNGSLIGFNAFALAGKFEFEPPSQSFFLLDKKRGKTVSIPILFDN